MLNEAFDDEGLSSSLGTSRPAISSSLAAPSKDGAESATYWHPSPISGLDGVRAAAFDTPVMSALCSPAPPAPVRSG